MRPLAIFLAAVTVASMAIPTQAAEPAFTWRDKPGEYEDLYFGDKPVMRYVYKAFDDTDAKTREATFKVYHHIYSPDGTRMITKGPGGLYTHHRGVFYGFNQIGFGTTKCDIWHGSHDGYKTMTAYQTNEAVLHRVTGPEKGGHTVRIAWHGPDKSVFIEEERTLLATPKSNGTLFEFTSKLTSKIDEPVKLDGDPQHAGFHFRADQEVADKTKSQTYYLRPDGKGKPGETRNWDPKTKKGPVNLPWNAMSFVLGDKRYTALYLDSPSNPKEARYSERDYGRFGSYFVATVTKDKPLTVHYELWIQNGEMTGPEAEAMSKAFVGTSPSAAAGQ